MTSRVVYSAQYHRQHCTLHAFEQFGALFMYNHDDKYPSRPGFEPGTPRLQAPVDTNEPSGLAAYSGVHQELDLAFNYKEKQKKIPMATPILLLLLLTASLAPAILLFMLSKSLASQALFLLQLPTSLAPPALILML